MMHRARPRLRCLLATMLTAILLATLSLVQPAFAAPSVSKVADPDTSGTWKGMFDAQGADGTFSFSTERTGRIWVDKSVYATAGEAAAAGIPDARLSDPDLDFLVGISAISSAAAIRAEQEHPHDVVFVVSLNSTLDAFSYDGRPQADHLADALNRAIGRLMVENSDGLGPSEPTRVAVVGYSIDASVLMPLGTYAPDEQGDYVRYVHPDGGSGSLNVVAQPDDPQTTTADGAFGGYAYLQRALSVAGGLLEDAASEADCARTPDLVVMGTEVAAAANTDVADPPAYQGQAQGRDGFLGSLPTGTNVGYGTDAALATLLTLQDVSHRVEAAYAASGGTLEIYTIGLDTQALGGYVLQTAQGQAKDVVDGTGAALGCNLCDNIDAARAAYAQAAAKGDPSVTLSLFSAGKGNLQAAEVAFPNPVDGLLDESDGYAFRGATGYFLSSDAGALPDSFNEAVDAILGIDYDSPVNFSPSSSIDPAERFHVQDDLGAFMTVKRVAGIEFEGSLLDGSLAAAAVAKSFSDPQDLESYHEVQYLMYALNARYDLGWGAYDLLYNAYSDGQLSYDGEGAYSNYAAWYVDGDHAMVPSSTQPYTFAARDEIAAAKSGHWEETGGEPAEKIEAARQAGAMAICQTYLYIGNLENQYSGADVPLYDFAVMVETSLDDGSQKLLLSLPADSIPALKAYVTQLADGGAVMSLDESATAIAPIRLIYEAGPRNDAAAIAKRLMTGESIDPAEIEASLGANALDEGTGTLKLYQSSFSEDASGSIEPNAKMSAITAATNGYYAFTSSTPLFQLKPGQKPADGAHPAPDQLQPLTTAPQPGETYYYEDRFFEADGLSANATVPARAVSACEPCSIAVDAADIPKYFAPDSTGQYCALAHTPKFDAAALLEDYAKAPNATGTAAFSKQLSLSDYSDLGKPLLMAKLGNNGLLSLVYGPDAGGGGDDPGQGGSPDGPGGEKPDEPGGGDSPDSPDPDDPGTPGEPDNPGASDDPETPDGGGTAPSPGGPQDPGASQQPGGNDGARDEGASGADGGLAAAGAPALPIGITLLDIAFLGLVAGRLAIRRRR